MPVISVTARLRDVALSLVAAVCVVALPSAASAQTPPSPPALQAQPPPPPKLDCGPKPEHPGRLSSDGQRRAWQRDATAYLECYKKYVLNLQQIAQDAAKVANEAIDEYNATIKQFEAAAKGE